MAEIITKNFRARVEQLVDSFVARIIAIEDYFVMLKTVTLSEGVLFLMAFGWWLWFCFFDVEKSSPVYAYIFSEKTWAGIFSVMFTLHGIGVLLPSLKMRSIAIHGYALIWFGWTMIAGFGKLSSTASPTMLILCLLAIIVAVRISREQGTD